MQNQCWARDQRSLTPHDPSPSALQIGEGSGWARWDLANWRPAALSALNNDDEDEPHHVDSAVEVRRDRVRLRVYRSVLGSA